MTEIMLVDARWTGAHGIGRFAGEVLARLPNARRVEVGPAPLSLTDPIWLSVRLAALRPPVFFSPGFNPPLFSPAPFVFTIHDLIHLDVPQEASLTKRAYYELVVKPAARRAFRVLTVSEYSRRRILKWANLPPERVVVVGNGVDAAFGPRGPRHEPGYPYVLYFWNGKPHKNMARVLEAFARLPESELRLVFSSPPDPETRHRALRLGISHRVVFADGIPEGELPAYYRGARVLAFPTLYEGFGLPALEAMACGTPVLTSNTTSLPEVVGDAALQVDPHDVDAIAGGLRRLLGDEALRATLRARGMERAKQFRWETVAARVRQVLEEAVDSR